MTTTTLTQNSLTGNFLVNGIVETLKVQKFFNGRFDGLHSSVWVAKKISRLSQKPTGKHWQNQIAVITLDLLHGKMNMKGTDYSRDYNVELVGDTLIVK
jgi:hypothetical protein